MHVCRKNAVLLHGKNILIWCNFNLFNTVLNSELFAESHTQYEIVVRSISTAFCFCISNTK